MNKIGIVQTIYFITWIDLVIYVLALSFHYHHHHYHVVVQSCHSYINNNNKNKDTILTYFPMVCKGPFICMGQRGRSECHWQMVWPPSVPVFSHLTPLKKNFLGMPPPLQNRLHQLFFHFYLRTSLDLPSLFSLLFFGGGGRGAAAHQKPLFFWHPLSH